MRPSRLGRIRRISSTSLRKSPSAPVPSKLIRRLLPGTSRIVWHPLPILTIEVAVRVRLRHPPTKIDLSVGLLGGDVRSPGIAPQRHDTSPYCSITERSGSTVERVRGRPELLPSLDQNSLIRHSALGSRSGWLEESPAATPSSCWLSSDAARSQGASYSTPERGGCGKTTVTAATRVMAGRVRSIGFYRGSEGGMAARLSKNSAGRLASPLFVIPA